MSEPGRNLCFNCFKERPDLLENPGAKGPCPYCGFDLEENAGKYPAALRAGTILKGRYRIGRVLGQGGFGITYLAWDERLAAKVAVKEYMPGEMAVRADGARVVPRSAARREDFAYGEERFREEARILAKFMGQPNIAGVTDYFDENDTSYFVMDYIEGISFKNYIAGAGGRVSPKEALDVMLPVLRALSAVHGEGLIHRDVTPDNIYITKDGNVKLLDFGSARYSLGDKSKSLDVILKVGYAPKEQYIRRGRQGPYTDVYSCAACLYAAITGYLPPESLERLDGDTLVPPSQMGAAIPLYLERAILKGLAVQPEDRFQTAGEFLEVLESQQTVELPDGGAGSPGRRSGLPGGELGGLGGGPGQTAAGQPASRQPGSAQHTSERPGGKKKSRLFLAAGCGAAAVALAAVLFVVVGKPGSAESRLTAEGTGSTREIEGAGGDRDAAEPGQEALSPQESRALEEATAPQVTICGESYSTALRELRLENADLGEEDFEALARMTNLEQLEIQVSSPASQLDFLKGLTKLKRLQLRGDQEAVWSIPDLSALAGLTQMEDLYLYADGISDLSPLSGMSQLKSFVLSGDTAVTDLTPLSGLTELQTLEIPGCKENVGIDLTPLSGLTGLRSLRTGSNVTDLTPLSGLTELRQLDLTYDGYSSSDSKEYDSLAPLAGLTNLTSLTIRNLKVSDLSPLSGLSSLRSLAIYNAASIRDLSPLAGLPNLKSLTIMGARNQLDASPLTQVSNISIEYR